MKANLLQANALHIPLADGTVQTCVTSPPYFGLRDYGVGDQIGLEPTLQEYIENICAVMDEVWRVLRDDGTLWLNLGDSYAGSGGAGGDYNPGGLKEGQPRYQGTARQMRKSYRRDKAEVTPKQNAVNGLKPKDLIGVPWRVALALQERGWYLRSDIIWHKPNPMPESVRDRPTKSHEYIFLLSKQKKYFYDADSIREGVTGNAHPQGSGYGKKTVDFGQGIKNNHSFASAIHNATKADLPTSRNKRTVWTVTTKPYSGAHFATFPPDLIEPCILAGSKVGDFVLDPFGGSGTTAMVAQAHGRLGVCLDLSWDYLQLAKERCGIKQMDEFYNGKKVEGNWDDLPMFREAV